MATNVWEGNGGTKNWSSAGDWSLSHVPIATEDVVINGTGSAICNLDQDTASLNSLTISAVGFNGNSWNINVAGSVIVTGGANDFGTSTLVLTASGNISNATVASAFYNVTQTGAITTTATGDVYTTGTVTTSNTGTVTDDGGGTRDFHINGTLVVGGVTWVSVSTFALWFGPGTIIPGDDYGNINIRIRFDSTATVTMGGAVTTTNGVLIGALANDITNTLDTGGYAFSCSLLQLGLDGQTARGGELSVTGVSTVEITSQLTVYADDGTQTNGITVAASGTNAFSIGGHWTVNTGGTMDLQDSTVTFDGTGAQNVTSGVEAFANVVVNKSAGTVTLVDAMTCDDFTLTLGGFDTGGFALACVDFLMTVGTFTANGSTVTCSGNCALNGGTFSQGTSTMDLTGTGTVANSSTARAFWILKCAAATKITTLVSTVMTERIEFGTGVLTASGTYRIQFWLPASGKLLTNAGVTVDASGGTNPELYVGATGAGISGTFDGINMGTGAITFQGGTGATFTLLGAFITSGAATVRNDGNGSTLDLDTFNLTSGALVLGAAANANVCTLLCGSGIVDCTSFLTLAGATGAITLNLESCTFQCSSDFTIGHVNHVIVRGTSEIVLDGSGAQAIDFNGEQVTDLTVTNTGGTVTFTTVPDIQGTFAPGNGASAITLRFPTSGTTHWNAVDTSAASGTGTIDLNSIGEAVSWALTLGSNQIVTSVDVTYSSLTGFTIDASDATNVDGGNNSANWNFGAPPAAADYAYSQMFGQRYGQEVGQL